MNPSPDGVVCGFTLELTDGATHGVTWFDGIKWDTGAPPTLSAEDVLGFYSYDGGVSWTGLHMSPGGLGPAGPAGPAGPDSFAVEPIGNITTSGLPNRTSGGDNNIIIGVSTAAMLTSGYQNVGIGNELLYSNTTGYQNVALGQWAMYNNTTGYQNVGIGMSALGSTTGYANVGVGYRALVNTSTGIGGTAVGFEALSGTFGGSQTAVGYRALTASNGGGNNTAVGYSALWKTISGNNNTALGHQAMYNNNGGHDNTAIGYQALNYCTSGDENTAIGWRALFYTTGDHNVGIGLEAGKNISTGSGNIVIGSINSSGIYLPMVDMATSNDIISMGHTSVSAAHVAVAWTTVSDARDKTNFAPVSHGLDFVSKLKPTAYQFRTERGSEETNGGVRYGFLAQDILALEGDSPVVIDADDPDKLRYNESSLIPILVKALQELKAEFDEYKATH